MGGEGRARAIQRSSTTASSSSLVLRTRSLFSVGLPHMFASRITSSTDFFRAYSDKSSTSKNKFELETPDQDSESKWEKQTTEELRKMDGKRLNWQKASGGDGEAKDAEVKQGEAKEEAKKEWGGPKGLEPTRYSREGISHDWEVNGRCTDF